MVSLRLDRLVALLAPFVAGCVALGLAAAPAAADYAHVVARGETLTSVAAADGLSVAALAAANGIATTTELITGTTLQIPPRGAATATSTVASEPSDSAASTGATAAGQSSTTSEPATTTGGYVVQVGDTLTAIAARDGTTVAQLAAANGLNPNRILLAGATLRLPGAATVATSETSESAPASESTATPTATATASTGSAGPPYPTDEYVTGSQIAQVAASNGVPPGLAEAIGWQESGFNNDEVSSAGAVGVMQITPATWSWINQTLTNGATLAPASASSNVAGGVLLLHSLLARTGSESEAAAGYYQGLASVQRSGLYASTQQYVNNVLALAARFGG